MENNPKKSKALIVTIIIIVIVLLSGFLIFKNRDSFGVKTSNTITKIFSPLSPSVNRADLTIVDVQAGEDIKKGDSVSIFGTGIDDNPIVVKSNNGAIYGYADEDIKSGYAGKIIIPNKTGSSSFWDSISNFVDKIFTPNPPVVIPINNICTNNAVNYPECTVRDDGKCINGKTNPPLCNEPNDNLDVVVDITAIPSFVNKNESSTITWTSTNTKSCVLSGGIIKNESGIKNKIGVSTGPLTSSTSYTVLCTGNDGSITSNNVFVEVDGNKIADLLASRISPRNGIINEPIVLSSDIRNIGNTRVGEFSIYFSIKSNNDNSIQYESIDTITSLEARSSKNVSTSYVFRKTGSYSIEVCADKNNKTNTGKIIEASETNNCSDPVNFDARDKGTDSDKKPDLVANKVTPSNALVNTPTTLSSIITNKGSADTGNSFYSYFNIESIGNNSLLYTSSTTIPLLPVGVANIAKTEYTFRSNGNYSVRLCADKNGPNDSGRISEENENNNCSIPTILSVNNSIPTIGKCLDSELLDTTNNNCIPYSSCIAPRFINEETKTCNSSGNICPSNQLLDTRVSPNKCIDKEDCNAPYYINNATRTCDNPRGTTPEVNKCLLISQNPLKFTDSEKAKLAELLRKFYIIASTLKTEDDISMIYREMDRYKSLISNLEDLTNQCYYETGSKDLLTKGRINIDGNVIPYNGPTIRSGNPFYNSEPWKSYIPANSPLNKTTNTAEGCVGSFNNKMKAQPPAKDGGACSQFKTKMNCEYYEYSTWFNKNAGLMLTGCNWIEKETIGNITDYEKILNIW